MTEDPDRGIRLLGEALPYADGAEDRLLEVMRGAGDRTSLSDELPASIVDWPTRYHLSRLRANLLRPLRLPAGARVLDVGAGTGALSRYLGEQGLEVVALEGSLDRARVAAERCRDLEGVEVVCGPLAAFEDDDGFDVVVVCGVLEYAHAVIGGEASAEAFLTKVRSLCRPAGALVLAIENRLGLKYLLGYAEDHLGRPWIGLEGYPLDPGVRTWSRRELGAMLAGAGFDAQRWLFPFPDYKLPTTVLDEAAYLEPDAARLVDQLVANPVVDHAHAPQLLTDDRAAHQALITAGIGPDVANSLVVVASSTATGPDAAGALLEPGVLAWRFGDERERRWLRTTRVHADDGGRRVTQVRPFGAGVGAGVGAGAADAGGDDDPAATEEAGWLRQVLVPEAPYHRGPTLQQQALDAARRHDVGEVRDVVERWRRHLGTLEAPPTATGRHPFLPAGTATVLPADHLDVAFDNFVVTDAGIEFVDPEWQVAGGVSTRLVVDRSLWGLARRLVTTGVEQPWDPALSVDELTAVLGAMCGEHIDAGRLAAWREAEAALQHVVRGEDPDVVIDDHVRIGRLSRLSLPVLRALPLTRLRGVLAAVSGDTGGGLGTVADDLRDVRSANEGLRRMVRELDDLVIELREDIHRVVLHGQRIEAEAAEEARIAAEETAAAAARAAAEIDHLRGVVADTSADREAIRADRDRLVGEVDELNRTLARIRSRLPYRLYVKARSTLGRS